MSDYIGNRPSAVPLTFDQVQDAVNALPTLSFRNRIQNGCFRILQRTLGASVPASTATIYADRWVAATTSAATQGRFASTAYGGIWAHNLSMATAAAGSYIQLSHRIETVDIADLVGKTVTLSFWMAAAVTTGSFSGSYFIGCPTATDNFGTMTYPINGAAFTVDGSAVRRTITFTVPANADKGMEITFRVTKDATPGTTLAFSIGSVQLEEGSKATPFERRPVQLELAMCQRYYHIGSAGFIGSASGAAVVVGQFIMFPVRMHHTPTLVLGTATENVNTSAINFAPLGDQLQAARLYVSSVAAGSCYYTNTYTASADL
jgi:hypothetical protein